jgi:hypothetical protein
MNLIATWQIQRLCRWNSRNTPMVLSVVPSVSRIVIVIMYHLVPTPESFEITSPTWSESNQSRTQDVHFTNITL